MLIAGGLAVREMDELPLNQRVSLGGLEFEGVPTSLASK